MSYIWQDNSAFLYRVADDFQIRLWSLHYGDIRDSLLYRFLAFILGLAIVMLSVTGVDIWWKKRAGRIFAASRRRFAGSD